MTKKKKKIVTVEGNGKLKGKMQGVLWGNGEDFNFIRGFRVV